MRLRQRVVVVVALGVGLVVVTLAANALLSDRGGGWFTYGTSTSATLSEPSDADVIREALLWIGAIGIWTSASLWLLRERDEDHRSRPA